MGAGDANMEKGEMRVEANISVSKTSTFGTKVEIKNFVYEENNSYLPNTILKQSLREGLAIKEDTEIELTVSKLED